MAGKRVTKSVVDWMAFMERVPAHQKDTFRAFKQKSDMFAARAMKYPENMPAIDFAAYRSKVANPAIVDQFEKQYKTVQIPFPSDSRNLIDDINKQEADAAEASKGFAAECEKLISDCTLILNGLETLPTYDEMTMDMYYDYFPDDALDFSTSIWPHHPDHQPDAPDAIK